MEICTLTGVLYGSHIKLHGSNEPPHHGWDQQQRTQVAV